MIRTQIQLTEEQDERLRRLAAERRSSLAELIRQAVDQYIERLATHEDAEARRRRALDAIGKYAGGRPDVSRDHDKYLSDAFRK